MSRFFIAVLMGLMLVASGEEIPESIQKGEWQYKWDGTKLPQARIPDDFWAQVPRGFIMVRMNEAELKAMASDKTLDAFVRSKTASLDDIVKVVYWASPMSRPTGVAGIEPSDVAQQIQTIMQGREDGYLRTRQFKGLLQQVLEIPK